LLDTDHCLSFYIYFDILLLHLKMLLSCVMETKNIVKRTKIEYADDVSYVEEIPRPVVAVSLNYPNNHFMPAHMHQSAQLLYASAGVMTVTTNMGIWVVPPERAVWVPMLTQHEILLDQIKSLPVTPLDLRIPQDPRLSRIYEALVDNPADNRSLEDWGHKVGACSRTLTRLFQAETAMSFRQWRQQFRILEALKRLGQGEPVTNIALDLGYDSPSAFICMFKKALGKTPGQYFKG
jgi:AraC-like DNA-binding protein